MRAADTNILVRLIAQDNPHQVTIAETFIEKGAWVPILVLAEAVWVLGTSYNRSAADIVVAVQLLLNHERLVLQDSETVTLALDLFRSRPSVSFSDCLILEIARKAGHLPLGTFDRKLAKGEGTYKL